MSCHSDSNHAHNGRPFLLPQSSAHVCATETRLDRLTRPILAAGVAGLAPDAHRTPDLCTTALQSLELQLNAEALE